MLRHFLQSILEKTEDLYAIIITDRTGVVISKVCSSQNPEVSQRSSFISLFGAANKQSNKLGLGDNKSIICFYDQFQVVSIKKDAVHVHLVGDPDGNTGLFLTLDSLLEPIIPTLNDMVRQEIKMQHETELSQIGNTNIAAFA